jgi:hypothetical protein
MAGEKTERFRVVGSDGWRSDTRRRRAVFADVGEARELAATCDEEEPTVVHRVQRQEVGPWEEMPDA